MCWFQVKLLSISEKKNQFHRFKTLTLTLTQDAKMCIRINNLVNSKMKLKLCVNETEIQTCTEMVIDRKRRTVVCGGRRRNTLLGQWLEDDAYGVDIFSVKRGKAVFYNLHPCTLLFLPVKSSTLHDFSKPCVPKKIFN